MNLMLNGIKPHGSGMGWRSAVKSWKSHGGRLWQTPHDGRGVTSHFTLPTAVVEVSAAL
jgi:signal transduction histidine kinase